ncbi:substrate-binding domain-containing protein [Methanomicrobium antiquum]|uniref:Substrate-binding domain-containing protein n=1 Tax=Methanomicrobium antiquum TaxID=487686 RepID=A0AAF0JN38_9EURY|nr:substrate-binding domain-containing protein [Methanomicrobium antiquum]MDD3977082.1 substrate-binding domain-containing protein [Methanomicrobium sp.]WFN37046.1 substrate-binding domain-containing protein [Methanomicrobium antiquum]
MDFKKSGLILLLIVLAGAVLMAGCTGTQSTGDAVATPAVTQTAEETPAVSEDKVLLIATTTSLDATGLLAELEKEFEEKTGTDVQITAVGTGAALELGANGDVDLLMVHDRLREDAFLKEGSATDRRVFAYNYFDIVGPESDPAGIKGMSPEDALVTIMEKGKTDANVKFVSRGDGSGTHGKEKALWKSAGYDYAENEPVWVKEDWYVEAGTGMGATLTMADEMNAYSLSDIGTFLKYSGDETISLVELVNEGDSLINIYGAMIISPEKYPETNVELSKEWINFLTSDGVQEEIQVFGVKEYGQPLFFPAKDAIAILSPSGVTQDEISAVIA